MRRFIPEIGSLPDAHLHAPWEAGDTIVEADEVLTVTAGTFDVDGIGGTVTIDADGGNKRKRTTHKAGPKAPTIQTPARCTPPSRKARPARC